MIIKNIGTFLSLNGSRYVVFKKTQHIYSTHICTHTDKCYVHNTHALMCPYMCYSMNILFHIHSIQQVYSLILSSQVAVEDSGFGSLALQKRPAMITFSLNKVNVSVNIYVVETCKKDNIFKDVFFIPVQCTIPMFLLELFKLVCYLISELTVNYGTSRSWSSEGMLPPSSNGSFIQCYSTHLTSFAVLLAVETFVCSNTKRVV